MKTFDEKKNIKLKPLVPSLQRIEEKFTLMPPAFEGSGITEITQQFSELDYTKEQLDETKIILFDLADKIINDKSVNELLENDKLRQKALLAKGELSKLEVDAQKLKSVKEIKTNIDIFLSTLKNNSPMTAAPRDENERKIFYSTLLKGFRYISEILKNETQLEPLEIYNTLEIIGNASEVCATGWKNILTDLTFYFREQILKRGDIKVDTEVDELKKDLKQIFFDARVVSAKMIFHDFVKVYYPNLNVAIKPHYLELFMKFLNKEYEMNLPVMNLSDSYIPYDGPEAKRILSYVKEYMDDIDIDREIFFKASSLFREKNVQDKEFYFKLVDWGGKYFRENKIDELLEDDLEEFFSQYLFARKIDYDNTNQSEDFSTNFSEQMREFAMRKLMEDTGFLKREELPEPVLSMQKYISPCMKHAIMCCIRDGDSKWLLDEIDKNDDLLKIMDDIGMTLLHNAVKYGNTRITKALIDKKVDINIKDKLGYNALHFAAESGNVEIAKLLLDNNINMYALTGKNLSVLHLAIISGNSEIVKLFVDKGYDVNLKTNIKDNYNALHLACICGNIEMVKLILNKMDNLNESCLDSYTALHIAVEHNYEKIVELLLSSKEVDVNSMTRNSIVPLHIASRENNPVIAEMLIKSGANINARDINDWTAIHNACRLGSKEVTKVLLKNGADINAVDKAKWTPLHFAAKYNKIEIVDMLIERGADIYAKTTDGLKPRYFAIKYGNTEIENKLNFASKLIKASKRGELHTVKSLLYNNNSIEYRRLALHYTLSSKRKTLSEYLLLKKNLQRDALVEFLLKDIDKVGKDGNNTLQWAAQIGSTNILEILKSNNLITLADLEKKNVNGFNVFDIAVKNGNTQILNSLNESKELLIKKEHKTSILEIDLSKIKSKNKNKAKEAVKSPLESEISADKNQTEKTPKKELTESLPQITDAKKGHDLDRF